jgi:asparagine synthase (glutamine-hydrolysing)
MCGIAGFVESSTVVAPFDLDTSQALVRRMCDVIRHRGPDDEGVWVEESVALGMRRLSIIDLSTSADPQRRSHGLDRVQR